MNCLCLDEVMTILLVISNWNWLWLIKQKGDYYKESVFYLFIYLFIYLWLCWVFVSVRGLSLVVASGGHSSSRCAGLSLPRPLLLRSTDSRRAGSVAVAHRPSCSVACGIFPDQGSNPCPLHWQSDSQPLHHQGSPESVFLLNIGTGYGWLKHNWNGNLPQSGSLSTFIFAYLCESSLVSFSSPLLPPPPPSSLSLFLTFPPCFPPLLFLFPSTCDRKQNRQQSLRLKFSHLVRNCFLFFWQSNTIFFLTQLGSGGYLKSDNRGQNQKKIKQIKS